MRRLLLVLAGVSLQANAAGFDLVEYGDMICRAPMSSRGTGCYTKLESIDPAAVGALIPLAGDVNVLAQLTNYSAIESVPVQNATYEQIQAAGAGFAISAQNRTALIRDFKQLEVRNIAVKRARKVNGFTEIAFVASVRWESNRVDIPLFKNNPNGTVNVEGVVRIPDGGLNLGDTPEQGNANLSTAVNVRRLSDSQGIERQMRTAHFAVTNPDDHNVDTLTKYLVENVAGPAVLGSFYATTVVVIMQDPDFQRALGDALVDLLTLGLQD